MAEELTGCVAKAAGATLVLSAQCSASGRYVRQAVCSHGTARHRLDTLLCRSTWRRSHAPLQVAGLPCAAFRVRMAAATAAAA